ncbi:MAG: hypothetical protein GTO24_06400, partial [candidate division Zixibacteria bacterium]|nr:hypothetical protein [candidate division Zixibacteria bacterium]
MKAPTIIGRSWLEKPRENKKPTPGSQNVHSTKITAEIMQAKSAVVNGKRSLFKVPFDVTGEPPLQTIKKLLIAKITVNVNAGKARCLNLPAISTKMFSGGYRSHSAGMVCPQGNHPSERENRTRRTKPVITVNPKKKPLWEWAKVNGLRLFGSNFRAIDPKITPVIMEITIERTMRVTVIPNPAIR